jgi:ubiquinone/menaquinone biosynthesis C-methylase UbiE
MTMQQSTFNDEVREIWDQNAVFWDERMGEGNAFHSQLVSPSIEQLLDLKKDEEVLEIACGNGQLARRMATLGARVLATDFSEQFLERARERTSALPDIAGRITYQWLDATDEPAMLALGERRFDAIVCSMGIMDMAEIGPMMRASARLLKPDGRFVFALCHPCFNHTGIRRTMEEEDRAGEIVTTFGIKVVRYLTHGAEKGLGMYGQPAAQYYFDRPLSVLFGEAFAAGFAVDGLVEAGFKPDDSGPRQMDWQSFSEIPPLMAARLRLLRPGL